MIDTGFYFLIKIGKPNRAWKIAGFLTILLSLIPPIHSQELKFNEIGSLQGLSHSTVYDITEDEDGFMWFGTREGLNRYDGYELKTYYRDTENEIEKGLSNDVILSLLSFRGRLLVGTSEGLNEYLPQDDSFTTLFKGKSIDTPVYDLCRGSENLVFISTANGLYTLDKENTLNRILEGITVKSVSPYRNDVYWVALNKKVLLINDLGEIIKEYNLRPGRSNITPNPTAQTLFRDSSNKTWLGTSSGLFVYREDLDDFVYQPLDPESPLEANVIRAITEDKDKNLWIGTESGLFVYNRNTEALRHYSHALEDNSNALSDKSIYSLYINDEGMAWVGTYFGGVNFTASKKQGFNTLSPGNNNHSLQGKAVSQVIEDKEDKLWIGTEDGGLTIFNRKKKEFSFLNQKNSGLSSNNIHALLEDGSGNIWIGTFLGGINKYDQSSGKISHYKHNPERAGSLSNNNVYAFLQDKKGKLWVGTQFGLNVYDKATNSFYLFKPEIFSDKFIYDMLEDKNGDIWICTRLSGIFHYKPSEDKIEHFTKNSSPRGLTSNQIISVTEDSEGDLWFGSLNGGVVKWNRDKRSFTAIGKTDGLPNNNVYGVVESKDKKIWITTNKGLTKLDPLANSFTNFTSLDGLPTNQFNFKSAYKDKEGWLYFGSVKGLTFFHPDSLVTNISTPEIHFTGFQLFNKDVPISKDGILKEHINFTDTLTLRNNENVITFEFAALNFESGNKYAYFLEGFDNSWNIVGNKRSATYTNLSPGEYTFNVQTLPLDRSNEKQIHLTILPPFWKTTWAYSIYALLLVLTTFGLWRFQRFIHDQKMAVKLEKVEKEKIQEINRHKLNFFTFISHEFKTPLTLILASLEKHFKQHHQFGYRSEELTAVQKSAGRLQHLINQLMEFRKTETDVSKIEYRKGDIILFLKDTFQAFSPLMDQKKLDHSCQSGFSEYFCYFDPDKLEMIVTNLISNAIKNTPENGNVNFLIDISNTLDKENRSRLELTVQDSGCGMAPEDIEKAFNPFFKTGNNKNSRWQNNSGIGLALVHNLTNLLQGKIRINSTKSEGSEVVVNIPLKLKHSGDDKKSPVIKGNKDIAINPDIILDEPSISEVPEKEKNSRELSILIVEDNKQIMKFLQDHFSGKFKTLTAKNGVAALKKLERHTPDMIISDLMMEEMDGINLCKRVRKNPKTNHIPFLLLTGKTERSFKMEGLRVGANAFINKPFSINEIDLIIKNLLDTNQSRTKRFSRIEVESLTSFPRNNQNEEFLKQIDDLVRNNYSNSKFTIEDLASKMGISRSLLHLKLKKATGSSASEFLKKVRLQKAAELIKQGMTIAEVAYKVGYNDPNYFSRVFKREFKVSPTSYKEKAPDTSIA